MLDTLTETVMEYKNTTEDDFFKGKLLKNILKMSEGLIYKVFNFYGVNYFAQLQQDEISADCQSLVLLKTIDAFDVSRKAKFSTFYTWRLKSHVRSKKEFFMRRKHLLQAQSLDKVVYESGGEEVHLGDILTDFNVNTLHSIQREMKSIFNLN